MPDPEHEEWMRDEAMRKASKSSPHVNPKSSSVAREDEIKMSKTAPEEDDDEDTDDDDADDELAEQEAHERDEGQQAGEAV